MDLMAEIWEEVRQVMGSLGLFESMPQARVSMEKLHSSGFSMRRSVTPSMESQASRTALVVKLRMSWVRFVAEVYPELSACPKS